MEELQKYNNRGSFKYYLGLNRAECFAECNAPSDESGIYLIYSVKDRIESLVYVGISGRVKNGNFLHRKDGIRGRLIEGKYLYTGTKLKVTRYKFFNEMIKRYQYDHLKIYWFVTYSLDGQFIDVPKILEDKIIKRYNPIWNR